MLHENLLEHLKAGRIPDTWTEDQLAELVSGAVLAVTPMAARRVHRRLKKTTPAHLQELRRQREAFERRLHRSWGKGIDALEALSSIFREFGDMLFRAGLRKNELTDPVFRALADLHARACRVTAEVICLLRAGLADGAHARWRTLHEVAVVSRLLAENGPEMATRYLLHALVKAHKAAADHQRHCKRLGGRPLTERQLQVLKAQRDALVAKYGKNFAEDWGWATGLRGNPHPNFRHLEEACALESLRPLVASASDIVHGGPRGLRPTGVERHGRGFLLAGASDAGIAEPGANTAISLVHIASTRYRVAPALENLLTLETMRILERECIAAFDAADKKVRRLTREALAREDARSRSQRKSAGGRKRR